MVLDTAGVFLVLIWISMMPALEMQRTWSGKSESTRKSRINVDVSFTVVKLMIWLTCYNERTSKGLLRIKGRNAVGDVQRELRDKSWTLWLLKPVQKHYKTRSQHW